MSLLFSFNHYVYFINIQCLESQRFYKKAAAFVLRSVAKHSACLATCVVNVGALDALVCCLEDFDPGVKEAAAWAIGYVARHNEGNYAAMLTLDNFWKDYNVRLIVR